MASRADLGYRPLLMLKAGIVGLPNVGKSTLFNAVTRTRKAQAENYPFCTIDPNIGVVNVPDDRLSPLAAMTGSRETIATCIEFVDIAGLVKGASEGAGLGNQFLANIREVDAVVQVVRCFENNDITHELGSVDPIRDIEIINTELILADLASMEKQHASREKRAKGGDREAARELAVMDKLLPHLEDGRPALTLELSSEEDLLLRDFFLLSSKRTIFACNVAEDQLARALEKPEQNSMVSRVQEFAAASQGARAVVISALIEEELGSLEAEEAAEFLTDMGVSDSGVTALIHGVYRLLNLRTFLTSNEKETHAWAIAGGTRAPAAAGVIHTDFERGFISAEVCPYQEMVESGSRSAARNAGKLRIEGKSYEVQDGDVIEFRFNV